MTEADILLGVVDEEYLHNTTDKDLAILEKWMIKAMEEENTNKEFAWNTLCLVWAEQFDRVGQFNAEMEIEKYLMETERC